MRNKILAANWKMNLTQPEVDHWLQQYAKFHSNASHKELRIYPSAVFIQQVSQVFHAGAQNFYFQEHGAFTGELSLTQLKSIGAQSVLIGHSERREIFHEDNQLIAHKVQACVEEQLPFILCCGETQAVRDENQHLSFIRAQLQSALQGFSPANLQLLTIAYEPIWAIGSGLSADQNQIIEMHGAIRAFLLEHFGKGGEDIPVLYGGSVTPANAAEIFGCTNVAGALVGGASLDPHVFNQLWEQL